MSCFAMQRFKSFCLDYVDPPLTPVLPQDATILPRFEFLEEMGGGQMVECSLPNMVALRCCYYNLFALIKLSNIIDI